VSRPPLSHPIDVFGAAEVILVLWFLEPAMLARRFPRTSAGGFRAVLLPPAVAHIDVENFPAALALTLPSVRHGSLPWRSIFTDHRPAAAESPAPSPAGTKSKANKTIDKNSVRRTRTKKTSAFRPSELDGNQVAADTSIRCRISLVVATVDAW
jgi:hypothetical protein